MGSSLTCPRCTAPLVLGETGIEGIPLAVGHETPCPTCGTPTLLEVFPALFRPVAAGVAGEAVISAEEAACFFHPQKRAVVPCDSCGRFLCSLCDVELDGGHLCPNCIQTGREKGRLKSLDNERVLFDRVALATALLPLFAFPFTLVTAPVALYLSIRHWNSPTSIVGRWSRVRFAFAIFFSVAEIGGWLAIISFAFLKRR